MKLLIVDDDVLSLSGLRMALEQRGHHECWCFNDPDKALEAIREQRFDAMITDNQMPGKTGIRLAREAKLIQQELPVILITGFIGLLDMQSVRAADIQSVIPKPVNPQNLLDVISSWEANPDPTQATS